MSSEVREYGWDLEEKSIDSQFEDLTRNLSLTVADEKERPKDDRIVVLIEFPHVGKFGHETTRELVYGCSFPVKVGDLVSCPPTRLHPKRTTGVITALGNNGYKGPVKYVRRVKGDESL